MKVLILGLGAVGSVIARELDKDKRVSEIVGGYRNKKRAEEFVKGLKKVTLKKIDASDTGDVAKNAKDVDIIINSSLPDFNLKIMKAALMAGCNYQDLASFISDHRTPEQLKYNKKFEKAGLLGLINSGLSPGLTNIIARENADKLDSVETIKIRLVEEQKSRKLVFAWSPITNINTIRAPPLVYRNGKFILLKPFSETEKYKYPRPFLERNSVIIAGDEPATIPKYIRLKNVDVMSTGTDIEFAKMLFGLGLLDDKPVKLRDKSVKPIELFKNLIRKIPTPKQMSELIEKNIIEYAQTAIVVEAIGKKSGRKSSIKTSVVFPNLREIQKKSPGATYISYPTGLSAASFTKIIHEIKKSGVFPPESLESGIRKKFFSEMKNKGIFIRNKQI